MKEKMDELLKEKSQSDSVVIPATETSSKEIGSIEMLSHALSSLKLKDVEIGRLIEKLDKA